MPNRTWPFALALLAFARVGAAQIPDHLQCYKTKDLSIILKGTVDLSNPTIPGLTPGCKISSAKLYCVPSEKVAATVFNITTPITPLLYSAAAVTDHRICYKVSCKSPEVPYPNQTVTDQFGTHTLSKLKTGMLCTPANQGSAYCGNANVLDAGEECDGTNLNGQSCVSVGFGSGTLACGAGCRFDTSGCIASAFPASGQARCWNAGGTLIPCAGTAQDGESQAGATLAYLDNGDGTVTDLNTGLMWEQKTDDGTIHDRDTLYTWANAFSHATALNTASFAGKTDWRIPNVRELMSILDYDRSGPAADPVFHTGCSGGCNGIGCSCTNFGGHWTSSTVASLSNSAWYVTFFDASVLALTKGNTGAVRAVRGGP